MPSEYLHSRLMEPTGVRNYVAIPTLASWKGDVVSAMHRLKRFLRKEQFEAQREASDLCGIAPGRPSRSNDSP